MPDDHRRPRHLPAMGRHPLPPQPGPVTDRRGFLRLSGTAGLLGALGAGGLALGAAGCSQPASRAKTSGSGSGGARIREYVPGPQPVSGGRYGGTVRVVWSDPPNSFDPALGYNLTAWDAITELVFFGGLMAYDKQIGGPVPNIAAAPPAISADSRTLTFRLRPGVKFHNGRDIVASDFIYSWERMLNPKLASWATSYLTSVAGANAVIAGKTRKLEGVQAPDDHTLVIHLAQPDFTILNALALPMTAPVPREEVERLGATRFGQTPVGCGPFRITSYDSAAQTATFERFDDYMYPGLPYLSAVTYRWGVDPQVQLLQLQNGDVDLLGPGIPSSQAAHVLATPALRALTQQRPSPGNLWMTIYMDKAPFSNQKVRQALNWAVDRAAIGRVTYGTFTPWGAPFPATIADFTPVFRPYGYDPARARQLLAEAGFPHGFSATLTIGSDDPYPAIAQIVQAQLAAVGVHLSISQVSSNALLSLEEAEQKGGGHLQLDEDDWYEVQPTPADEVDALYTTGASSNYNRYSNPQVDKLAAQARETFDETARNKLYAQIQQIIGDDAPFVFLLASEWLAGVGKRVHNYQYRGETYSYYDRMWV
jgi:ABC-type transport system substrate-binding protein